MIFRICRHRVITSSISIHIVIILYFCRFLVHIIIFHNYIIIYNIHRRRYLPMISRLKAKSAAVGGIRGTVAVAPTTVILVKCRSTCGARLYSARWNSMGLRGVGRADRPRRSGSDCRGGCFSSTPQRQRRSTNRKPLFGRFIRTRVQHVKPPTPPYTSLRHRSTRL